MSDRKADTNALAEQVAQPGRPPLHRWHPPLSGDMDLVIRADGQWIHEGEPIMREALVRLFASILRREDDGDYYLVTPVEKWRIRVEEAPLLAVLVERHADDAGPDLTFTLNTGETVVADKDHSLNMAARPGGDEAPFLSLDHGLSARVCRAPYHDLVAWAEPRTIGGREVLGIRSRGEFFVLGALG